MPRTFSIVAAISLLAGAALLAQNSPESRIRRIEQGLLPPVVVKGRPVQTTKLEERMRELRIPGVSVAVFHNGRIEWTREWGLADVELGRKVKADTRFQAASISKPVAAAAALALVERGRLSLDRDVNDSLRSWKIPVNEHVTTTSVTLRHLLTHSAGLTVSGFRGYATNEPVPTIVQVLDGEKPANSAPVRVDIPVGTRWRYSGGGYSVVQLLIEDDTRKPFAQAARQLVLEPFGMTRSTFVQPLPPDLREDAATGYRADGTAVAGRWHTYPEQAAAGLWTTPADLARFAIEIQRIAAGRSTKVMSQARALEMLQRSVEDYGLGFGVSGQGREMRFGHGGSNEGFRCYLVAYRDTGSGIAIMTNSDNGHRIAQDIVRAVAREYGWPGLAPVERTLGTGDPTAYKDFAGRYELPIRTPPVLVRIELDEGRLFLWTGPQSRVELFPEQDGTFFTIESDYRIEFVRDGSGRVTEARIWQGETLRRAPRHDG